MPKQNIDYSKIIIYKIVCKDLNIQDVYVGSTSDFRRRKCEHKRRCNAITDSAYNHKKYIIIRENGGWDNWDMIEIEKYPCNDGNEARQRERYWYESLQSTLNTLYPNKSKKEYFTERYQNKKEEIEAKKRIIIECECGCLIQKTHRSAHIKTFKHLQLMNKLNINY